MIFDTHAHYDDHQFDTDREEVLSALSAAGVGRIVDVGSTVESLDRVREIADTHDFALGAVGLHPDEVGGLTPAVMRKMREMLEDPKIAAVGEIGLDYHWDVEPHDVQIRCFQEQIRLAWETRKPIIVHSRTAAADTMAVIQEMYGKNGECGRRYPELAEEFDSGSRVPGIIHSYSGSYEQAKIYTALGFYLGIGGVVTYPTSKKLKKVVKNIPLDHLVLETDCPYLSPEPVRGTRNTSANLRYVVRAVAEIREISGEEVERVTYANAERIFGTGRFRRTPRQAASLSTVTSVETSPQAQIFSR